MNKKACIYLLVGTMMLSSALPVHADTISDLKAQMAQTQAQLAAINGQASGLEGQKDAVEEEISALDGQLVELMASIDILEDEIEDKKVQIAQAQSDLKVAQAQEKEQYDSMKKRIKFMYEKGDATYAQLLFESKSISDMLNKADYIEKLYDYDRRLLNQFKETVQMVADLKDKLETEKSDLEAEEYELEEEKGSLQVALNAKKQEASNFDVQIAQIRQSAVAYKALVKQQTAQIKQLEAEEAARKAREEAERKAREEAERKAREEADKKAQQQAAAASEKEKEKEKAKESGESSGSSKTQEASSSASASISSSGGSAKGKEVANYACKFIGNPYVAGGTSLTEGADCSGFTQAVYRNFGISLPRNSASQRAVGKEVSYADAQPGDLICYAGHVALYIGNGTIVHASTQKTGIKTTPATYREILSVRRVV